MMWTGRRIKATKQDSGLGFCSFRVDFRKAVFSLFAVFLSGSFRGETSCEI